MAELADDHRLRHEGHECARHRARPQARRRRAAARQQPTGFEPFLIAAVLGLGIWALILTAIFL
jgi:hypothetical protein